MYTYLSSTVASTCIHFCTSSICFAGSTFRPDFFAPQIFRSITTPAVNTATCKCGKGWQPRLRCISATCEQERAALVQIANEGKVSGEGLRGDGINGR